MRHLLLGVSLALCVTASAWSAEAEQPYVKKFNAPPPTPSTTGRIQSMMVYPDSPAPAAGGTAVPSAPGMAAMPMVPASQPGAAPLAPSASSAAPAGTASAAPLNPPPASPADTGPTAVPGNQTAESAPPSLKLTPGVPVKTYATLAQAAKDGIDPLGENKATPPAVVAEKPSATALDLARPDTWLPWLQTHQQEALQYGGILLVGLAVGLLASRRPR